MKRRKFKKNFKNASTYFDRKYYQNSIKKAIEGMPSVPERGHYDLIICMEELNELAQALSKQLRGQGDRWNILEEIADVLLCIGYIKEILNIDDDDIVKAMNVKVDTWDFQQEDDFENRVGNGSVLSKKEINDLLESLKIKDNSLESLESL